jgi:hypothetical protein
MKRIMGTKLLLACAFGLTASASQSLMCLTPYSDLETAEIVSPPTAPDYDPARYARYLYSIFGWAFDAPDKLVLIGTLAPRWSDEQPLLHERLTDLQSRIMKEFHDQSPDGAAFSAEGVNVEFSYHDALDFRGGQMTDKGLVPMRHRTLNYVFGVYEEGYAELDPLSSESVIFAVDFDLTYGILDITAHSRGPCEFQIAAPDPVAIGFLTACITNHGCD